MPQFNLCAIGLTAWHACSVSPDLPLPQEEHRVPLGLDLHVVQISSEESDQWMLVDIIPGPGGLVEYLKMRQQMACHSMGLRCVECLKMSVVVPT